MRTGKSGQVAFELQHTLAPLGDFASVHQECSFSNSESVWKVVAEVKLKVIINLARYTTVDKAEGSQHWRRLGTA